MRLIDADALYAVLMEESTVIARGTGRNRLALSCKAVADIVQDAPTVDAEPIWHGRWKRISPARIYECSKCGQVVMTCDIDVYKYCHGCGAKMEVDDETD